MGGVNRTVRRTVHGWCQLNSQENCLWVVSIELSGEQSIGGDNQSISINISFIQKGTLQRTSKYSYSYT